MAKNISLRKIGIVGLVASPVVCYLSLSKNDMWMAILWGALFGHFAVIVSGKQWTPAGKVVEWVIALVMLVALGFKIAELLELLELLD